MIKKEILEDAKEIINPNIYKSLYFLMKFIFLGKDKIKENIFKKLREFVSQLNFNGFNICLDEIENKRKKENKNVIIKSIHIIFNFVKSQNFLFASEIMENIIIMVISKGFKVPQSDFFGKYIYDGLNRIHEDYEKKLINDKWINNDALMTFLQLNEIIQKEDENDLTYIEDENKKVFINHNILFQILLNIIISKKINNIYNELKPKETKGNYTTSIYSQRSNRLNYNKKNNEIFGAATSLLISAYIYYHNFHNPLMNYTQKKSFLSNVPFSFELSEAGIDDKHLFIVIKPIRIDSRIAEIAMSRNRFGFEGILELRKALIFNKNIKKIYLNHCYVKSRYMHNFFYKLETFKNKNVETLDLSTNYFRSDVDIILTKLISTLRGLKFLNLSQNNLRNGIGAFFVALKNLYKKNETELETLILIKCHLDDISFYELGELLKSKYCKLSCLCLNWNSIPSDVNFFNSLKKNRSLKEIYLYDCNIGSEKIDEIERIISNTNLECIYIYHNDIHDFNQIIRIIHRNKIIKCREKSDLAEKPCFNNLNLKKNKCLNKNSEKIKLIKEGIEKTNLICLDILEILKNLKFENNKEPKKEKVGEKKEREKKYKAKEEEEEEGEEEKEECEGKEEIEEKDDNNREKEKSTNKYDEEIKEISKFIENIKKKYKKALKSKMINDREKSIIQKSLNEEDKKMFRDYELKIKNIINNYNSKFSLYIRKQAIALISKQKFKNEKEGENYLSKLINYIKLERIKKNNVDDIKNMEQKKLILI